MRGLTSGAPPSIVSNALPKIGRLPSAVFSSIPINSTPMLAYNHTKLVPGLLWVEPGSSAERCLFQRDLRHRVHQRVGIPKGRIDVSVEFDRR